MQSMPDTIVVFLLIILFSFPPKIVSDLRFVTVTIRGSSVPRRHPGDDEPNVAQRLAMDVHRFSRYLPPNSLYFHYARIMTALMDRFHQMINPLHSGHRPTWWEATPTPPDEMTYECDASLGSPAVGDCSRLLLLQQGWGGGRLSDTVQVSPGAPKTLVSSRCLRRGFMRRERKKESSLARFLLLLLLPPLTIQSNPNPKLIMTAC